MSSPVEMDLQKLPESLGEVFGDAVGLSELLELDVDAAETAESPVDAPVSELEPGCSVDGAGCRPVSSVRADTLDRPSASSLLVPRSKRTSVPAAAALACVSDPFLFDVDADAVWVSAVAAVTRVEPSRVVAVLDGAAPLTSLPARVAAAVAERLVATRRWGVLAEVRAGESRVTVLEALELPELVAAESNPAVWGPAWPGTPNWAHQAAGVFGLLLGGVPAEPAWDLGVPTVSGPDGVAAFVEFVADQGWGSFAGTTDPGGDPVVVPSAPEAAAVALAFERGDGVAAAVAVAAALVSDPRFCAFDVDDPRFELFSALGALRPLCVAAAGAPAEFGAALAQDPSFAFLDPRCRALLVAAAVPTDALAWMSGDDPFVFGGGAGDVVACLEMLVAAAPSTWGTSPWSRLASGRRPGPSVSELGSAYVRLLRWLVEDDPSLVSDPGRVASWFGVEDLAGASDSALEQLCVVASALPAHPSGGLGVLARALVVAATDGGRRARPGLWAVCADGQLPAEVTFAVASSLEVMVLECWVRAGRWSAEELASASVLHPDVASSLARVTAANFDGCEPPEVADWVLGNVALAMALVAEAEGPAAAFGHERHERHGRPLGLRVSPAGSLRARTVAAASALPGDAASAFWVLADSFLGTPEALADVATEVAA